ncbi:high nitrogen upregulated cytochrome P450 monooxygenase 2 [Mycena amicta]|nr:high nitrogen upregulated cytochrome P450 monooxygenase 2 [Mycena amicta]
MASQELIFSAVLLGLANHVYFNRFEPKSANRPFLALVIQPLLLVVLLSTPPTVANALGVSSVFFASLALSIVAYRLSPWHPLAHVPGPIFAKISKWWSVRLLLSGNQHRVLKSLHDRYGDFVRIGPNEVSIIHADAIKSVFGTSGFQKGQYYEPRADPALATRSMLTLRGDAHANRRRIWNRGMSSESLKEFEGILEKRLVQLLARLDEFANNGKGGVDMAAWFSYFMFDFMGDMAFGGGFEMLRDGGDKEGLWTLIKGGAKNIATVSQIPWLAPTLYIIPGFGRNTKLLRRFGVDCAEKRIKSGPKLNKDLWYHLMDEAGHEQVKPTLPEVVADGVLAIVAGSDTSSVALSAFIWSILSNPEIYARAQAEVDAVYPDAEGIFDSAKHGELKFLTACLNETLRLFPPVPTGGARQVPAGPPRLVAGRLIPEHTQIYVPAYAVHRSPKHFFPGPETFDPDRWLRSSSRPGNNDHDEILNHAAFIPFSYGAANCVGKGLAWREMLMVSSALLKRYNMRFARASSGFEETWVDTLEDVFVTSVGGRLMVEISLR